MPQAHDAPGACLSYYECVARVYLAEGRLEKRSALRLALLDLKREVFGEAPSQVSPVFEAFPGRAGGGPHQPLGCTYARDSLSGRRRADLPDRDACAFGWSLGKRRRRDPLPMMPGG